MPIDLSHLLDKKDLKKQPIELRKICEQIFCKGKGLRSQLVSMVGSFIHFNQKEQLFLSRIVEYIHNSSLLHDDFIDHSRVRRSQKTAWLEFSPAQAVLAGDYLLAKVNIYLAQEGNTVLIRKTAEVICQLAEGEFLQRELISFRDKNLKKRNKVSELKTASLFQWCLQAPFIYKNRKERALHLILDRIGFCMGLLFQRSDDLMDFSVRNKDKKPYLADIRQKQFNSFACFLLKGSSIHKEEQLKQARSISTVSRLFPDFKDKVQAFDQINIKIIEKTKQDLNQLKPFLKKQEQALIPGLQEWVDYVYWRKQQ